MASSFTQFASYINQKLCVGYGNFSSQLEVHCIRHWKLLIILCVISVFAVTFLISFLRLCVVCIKSSAAVVIFSEPEVRYHLAKVYTCLAATTVCATVGASLHISGILEAGLLVAIGSFALVIALHFIKDDGKNFYSRFAMLLGFGFCSGQTLGPLLQFVIFVNPQIVVTALTGTCIVFVSLTLSALLAEQGKFLFLGGLLVSIINTMILMSLLNLFVRSHFVSQSQLYIGLGLMSAFILYDTQSIIEKCRMGNKDCVQHSLDLFFDLISIFRRLLIILTQKEERDRQNKRKSQ